MSLKKRKVLTAIAALLLTGLYIIIFCFSAEDADASSNISTRVTKYLLKIYYWIVGSGGQASEAPAVEQGVSAFEGIVRKMAHFTEYMGVGILSYTIVLLWMGSGWSGRLLVVAQLIFSAGLDEWHQSFVPGRYPSVRDVAIDTAGGIVGIVLLLVCKKIRDWWRRRRRRKISQKTE